MSLCKIVPTLGLLALAGAAQAADISTTGFVDTILTIEDVDTNKDPVIDFSSGVELRFAANLSADVKTGLDVEFDADTSDAYLEAAYVSWTVDTGVTVTMGNFESGLGWEAQDAPGLTRVNQSIVRTNLIGSHADVTGVALNYANSEKWNVTGWIVDGVVATDDGAGDKPGTTDLALGVDFTAKPMDALMINVELWLDMAAKNTDTTSADWEDVLGLGINGDFEVEKDKFTLYWDLEFRDFDQYSAMGLLLGATYQVNERTSLTANLAFLDPNDDDDKGGKDDEQTELALAIMHNPIDNFSTNVELRFIQATDVTDANGDGKTDDDKNSIGLFFEMLAQF